MRYPNNNCSVVSSYMYKNAYIAFPLLTLSHLSVQCGLTMFTLEHLTSLSSDYHIISRDLDTVSYGIYRFHSSVQSICSVDNLHDKIIYGFCFCLRRNDAPSIDDMQLSTFVWNMIYINENGMHMWIVSNMGGVASNLLFICIVYNIPVYYLSLPYIAYQFSCPYWP